MLILKVMTMSGPQSMKATLIPDSPDGLAIVDKWNDGPHSMSVVAPLPETDVYVTVASPHDLNTPDFPRGKIAENLVRFVERLPAKCREYGNTASSVLVPLDAAVARYLGVLTTEQVENHARLVRESRAVEEAAREQEARVREVQETLATESLLASYRKGSKITGEQFEALLELAGAKIAPGTLGTIRKNLVAVQVLDGGNRILTVGRRSKPPSSVTQLAYQLWKG